MPFIQCPPNLAKNTGYNGFATFDGEKQSGYNGISDSTVFFLFSRPGLPKNDVM